MDFGIPEEILNHLLTYGLVRGDLILFGNIPRHIAHYLRTRGGEPTLDVATRTVVARMLVHFLPPTWDAGLKALITVIDLTPDIEERIMAIQYMLQTFRWCEERPTPPFTIGLLREMADVFRRVGMPFVAEQVEDYLRVSNQAQALLRRRRTVYRDAENVHDTQMNTHTLQTMAWIIERYNPQRNVASHSAILQFLGLQGGKETEETWGLRECWESFDDLDGTTLPQILTALVAFHHTLPPETRPDFVERVKTELAEIVATGSPTCFTGKMARLVATVHGYGANTPILNHKTEMRASVAHLLPVWCKDDKELENAIVVGWKADQHRPLLTPYVRSLSQQWTTEYGFSVEEGEVLKVLEQYISA